MATAKARAILASSVNVSSSQYNLRLQCDADGQLLFLAHDCHAHVDLRTVTLVRFILPIRYCRDGGVHPITLSALRQAAA
jgi:hypothetical protein